MSYEDPVYYLWQLFECAEAARSYAKGMDEYSFRMDRKTRDAVLTRITALAEAAEKLPQEFKAGHPAIPWEAIRGMRNRIVHDYHGIDPGIVWEVCRTDLPDLVNLLTPLLAQVVANGRTLGEGEKVEGYLVGCLTLDGRGTAVLMSGSEYRLCPWREDFAAFIGEMVSLGTVGDETHIAIFGKQA